MSSASDPAGLHPGPRDPKHDSAFEELVALVGPTRATREASVLERYGRSNVLGSPMPIGVVRPETRDQAVAAVTIAAKHRLPLYPVSRGQNWGYGATCPPTAGHVVLDLRDLNRILEVDVEMGYAVVEPGVTPRQLHAYLVEHDLPLMMDCTDATPDTSVLGNIMDRGMGFTPNGDRFANACAFEVVLADGTVLETGLAHWKNARARHLHKWGTGPAIDGLFTQSSLGIVLRLTTWLMPKPEAFRAVFAVVRPGTFEAMIDRMRELRLAGVVNNTVHISPARWPSSRAPEGAWLVMAGLYGPTGMVREAEKTVMAALAPLGAFTSFDPDVGSFPDHIRDVLAALGIDGRAKSGSGDEPDAEMVALEKKVTDHLRMFAELHRGVPFREDVVLITPHPSIDAPERARFGHYSYGPVSPARGTDAAELLKVVGGVFAEYGMRYTGSSFVFINPRTLISIAHVVFDHEDPASTERAKKVVDRLLEELMSTGFVPYRVGIQSMTTLDDGTDPYWATVRKLKAALDPDGILAVGRYHGR